MLYILLIIIGLVGIVKSGDTFVDQSIAIAKKFKISSFVIGFTIVAFGTSLPELVISLYSAYTGNTDIAVSNVIGSNITNICLIIGLLALYKPYKLSSADVKSNIPWNLVSLCVFLALLIFNDSIITFTSGAVLVSFFLFTLVLSRRNNHKINIETKIKFNPLYLLLSLLGLILFGKLVVDSILGLSDTFGISETFLGFFVVAIGTSLPEFIVTFTSLKKGNESIGIGNILGSNLFNLLFILGTSSIITSIDLSLFIKELLILLLVTISLVVLGYTGKKYYFSKVEGLVLIIFYVVFVFIQM